jgi:2-keto-4-pentenoate hydratase/2-oxohepta-3-ene-1,7-dioic acid hydratase in catechol pathway
MRLVTYRQGSGERFGVAVDGGIVDGGKALAGRFADLRSVLAAGALPELARVVRGARPEVMLEAVQLLPPIPRPDKILCVGINYHAHREETGRSETAYPTLFTRFFNTQVGHGEALIRPRDSTELDYEAELAVVIGKRGHHVKREDALSLVAGYSCYQDATLRDWQRHTSQFTPGKNFVRTGGFGPWIVTADEIPDPSRLTVTGRLNGQEVQRSGTDLLIFDVPTLIAYITTFTELVPGDVISTGTPGGVGSKRTPPVWMKAGDVFEVEVSGVGVLRNPVVDEDRGPDQRSM